MSKFRCGVAPLKIETGRYIGLPPSERTCFNCVNKTENEFHVVMECPLYRHIREELFDKVNQINNVFSFYDENKKFVTLFCDEQLHVAKYVAKACHDILVCRRLLLYK